MSKQRPWRPVQDAARGRRSDYRAESRPVAPPGGQGIVYRAVHKASGIDVAIKVCSNPTGDALARMRREIDIADALDGNRRIMPILDAADDASWFVMPLATRTAAERHAALRDDDRLQRLIAGVCKGLAAAHAEDWVHRDIKPENILYLDSRWVVADWGLGRRPRGETTADGRTRTGVFIGSERFSAPELADDAHEATPAADVYSVGQIIGWAKTGTLPRPFQPLVPTSGPWRAVARSATSLDPRRRPQSIEGLLALIDDELNDPPLDAASHGEGLLQRIEQGVDPRGNARHLWTLAARSDEDYDLFVEALVLLPDVHVRRLTQELDAETASIVEAWRSLLDESGSRFLSFGRANRVVLQLLEIGRAAASAGNWGLMEDTMDVMFEWDAVWDQWNARDSILGWLRSLDGEAARVAGGALRRNTSGRDHFQDLADDRRVDKRVRAGASALK